MSTAAAVRAALMRAAVHFDRHPETWITCASLGARDRFGRACLPRATKAVEWDLTGRLACELGAKVDAGLRLASDAASAHASMWLDQVEGHVDILTEINDSLSSPEAAASVARWLAMFVSVGMAREYQPEAGAPSLLGQMRQRRPSAYGPQEAVAL